MGYMRAKRKTRSFLDGSNPDRGRRQISSTTLGELLNTLIRGHSGGGYLIRHGHRGEREAEKGADRCLHVRSCLPPSRETPGTFELQTSGSHVPARKERAG